MNKNKELAEEIVDSVINTLINNGYGDRFDELEKLLIIIVEKKLTHHVSANQADFGVIGTASE